MKTSKYVFAFLLFSLSSALTLQAQDTIKHRNVQVEREYRPVIHDAGKINSMPQVLEPNVTKEPADYSDFNMPLNADYNIHILPAAELITEKPEDSKKGYARLGFGNYLNTLADFAYPVINTTDMRLDFSLNHLATFDSKMEHTTTKANLAFDIILLNALDFYAGLGGGHEHFNYYGNYYDDAHSAFNINSLDADYGHSIYLEKNRQGINSTPQLFNLNMLSNDPSETLWRFNALVGVRSLPLSTNIRYQAELQYKSFNSHNGINEKQVITQAGISIPNENDRLGLDFELNNLKYSSFTIPEFNFWKSYSVLTLNPYYGIERPEYNVRLGFKTSLSFVHGRPIDPSLDVRAEWKAVPNYFSIYGGITGDYEVNTLDKIYTENPYVYSDLRLNDTYTPYDFFAGIKVKPLYNLLLDFYVDSKRIDNQYFFVNKGYRLVNSPIAMPLASDSAIYSNRFNVVYSGASHVKMGFRANYNFRNMVNVELKWAYNTWNVDTEKEAWNMPKQEVQLNTNVRITDYLTVTANVYYEGNRFAKLGNNAVQMADKVDINLGIAYSYYNWLTVFGKINNVINNQYQDYYGYNVQGTNMMIGAAVSF